MEGEGNYLLKRGQKLCQCVPQTETKWRNPSPCRPGPQERYHSQGQRPDPQPVHDSQSGREGQIPIHYRPVELYFQVRVSPEDEKYNTIKTPFGFFACRVMLQGDTNALATAMRVIEYVLDGLIGKNVWTYLDDITIFSDT